MGISARKLKNGIIIFRFTLILSFILSSCSSFLDESVKTPDRNIESTPTIHPEVLATQTITSTPSPTLTQASQPTMSATSVSYSDGDLLFEADFEAIDNAKNLFENGAAWQIKEDEDHNRYLCNLDQTEPYLYIGIGDRHWTNYLIEFDVKDLDFAYNSEQAYYTKEEYFRLRFRDSESSYYRLDIYFVGYKSDEERFSPEAHSVVLGKKTETGESLPLSYASIDETSIENQWYTMAVKADEGNISFYWDNEILLDYQDIAYLGKGRVALFADHGFCFDNIRITYIGHK